MYSDISKPVEELSTLVYKHFGQTPMGWTQIDKLTEYAHNEQFVKHVFDLKTYLEHRKSLFLGINPSQYYKIIYKFQLASKSLSEDISKIVDCYLFLANYAIRVYNFFYIEIEQFVRNHLFVNITTDNDLKKITLLSATLRSFSEVLYCDEHTISGEIYSPIFSLNEFVIARKYRLLNAYEFREELVDCQYEEIHIYIKYRGIDNPPSTDIVGNLLTNINIAEYICGFCVEIRTKNKELKTITSYKDIDEVIQYFQHMISELLNNFKSKSLIDKLWTKILCEYYAMKPYADECEIDWKPIQYPINIIELENPNRPIVAANNEILKICDEQTVMQRLIELNDPRIHWSK